MKIYLFSIHNSDFSGWVIADTTESAKKAISELYGKDIDKKIKITESTEIKAMAIGSYPWEYGWTITTMS